MRSLKSSRFSIRDQCLRLTNHKSTYVKLYTLLKEQRSILTQIYSDINNKLKEIEEEQKDGSETNTKNPNDEKEIDELNNIFLFLEKILKYDLCKLILNSSRIMAKLSKYSIHCARNETRNMMITSKSSLTLASNIVKTPNSDDQVNTTMTLSKIRNLVETACVFFVKFQSMMLSSFKYIQTNHNRIPMGAMQIHTQPNRKADGNKDISNNESNNSTGEVTETLICRLCNEHIDADRFDEHIKACANAYKSDLKLKDINAAITNQIDEIKQHFISTVWPGDLQDATTIVLPILHVAILLRQAKAVDASTSDGLEELEDIELSLFQIPIAELENEKMNIHDDDPNEPKNSSSRIRKRYQTVALSSAQTFFNRAVYMKSILLIQDKIKASVALNSASNVLKSTRISGSDRVSEIVKITDFILLKKISAGAFARVFLAQMKKTGDIFAIKVTPKSSLKHKNEVSRIIIEKNIMLNFNNPYIVNFYYSIIGKNNLYLVMEYLPGGDLYSLLQGVGSFDETTARIYTLEILQALLYLRQNGIVHRDLKPDNLLISSTGHIRLADFGLSHLGLIDRQNSSSPDDPSPDNFTSQTSSQESQSTSLASIQRQDSKIAQLRIPQIASSCQTEIDVNSNNNTITFYNRTPGSIQFTDNDSSSIVANDVVGTPDYIAPEILMSLPHGFTVDYWSLGCMLFEFLVGIPPFHAATEIETFKNILTGKMHPFEEDQDEEADEEDVIEISNEAKDLILKLLEPDPSKRLGVNGVEEIRDHPWFDEFKGQDVDKIEPPFKPQLKGIDDTGYFKQRYSFKGRDDEDIIEDIANEFDGKGPSIIANDNNDNETSNDNFTTSSTSNLNDDDDNISLKTKRANKSVDLKTSSKSSLRRHNSSDNFTHFLESISDYSDNDDDENSSDSSVEDKKTQEESQTTTTTANSTSAATESENDSHHHHLKRIKWNSEKKDKKKKSQNSNDENHPGSFSFKKKKRNDMDLTSKNSNFLKKKKSRKELMSDFQSIGIDQIMKKNIELSKTRTKKDKDNKNANSGKFVKSSSTNDLNKLDQENEKVENSGPSSLINSFPQSPLLCSFDSTGDKSLSASQYEVPTESFTTETRSTNKLSSPIATTDVKNEPEINTKIITTDTDKNKLVSDKNNLDADINNSKENEKSSPSSQPENDSKHLYKKSKNENGTLSCLISSSHKMKSSLKTESDSNQSESPSSGKKKASFSPLNEENKKPSKKEKGKEKVKEKEKEKEKSHKSHKFHKKNSNKIIKPENKSVSASSISTVTSDKIEAHPKTPPLIQSSNNLNDLLEPKPRVRAKRMLATKQFVLNTASIHIESHTKSKIAARRKNRDRRLSLIAEQNS